MNVYLFGVHWLTHVCRVAWKTGQATKQWQASEAIPIHKRKCIDYWGIFLNSVPFKVCAKCLEKKCQEIVKPKLTSEHNGPDFCLTANL